MIMIGWVNPVDKLENVPSITSTINLMKLFVHFILVTTLPIAIMQRNNWFKAYIFVVNEVHGTLLV